MVYRQKRFGLTWLECAVIAVMVVGAVLSAVAVGFAFFGGEFGRIGGLEQ